MKNLRSLPALFAPLVLASTLASTLTALLAGCAAPDVPGSGRHLTTTQCGDLTELRNNAPPNRQRNASELAALRRAGYDPSPWFDPYYPDDLRQAQRQVDLWFEAECR